MISQINFRNYKLFKKKQILEIKPLTILIGKNNTGKSAILKLPTLLDGSLSGRFSQPFELNNNDVKIANEYKDIVYGRNNREVEFEILQKKHISDIEYDNLKVEIFIDENKPIIENWKCNNIFDLTKLDENNYQNNKINKVQETFFEGINLKSIEFVDDLLPKEDFFPLPKFVLNTDFIGAIRHEALKHYEYSSNISEKSGIDGSKLYDFLIDDYLSTDKKYFNQISNFIKDKFEGWEISIELDGGRKDKPAIIYLQKGNLKINISQVGMGISQVLPLIIRAYKPCDSETLIIVEEPESHLHPYAHAQVAQLFCDSLSIDKNKKYLIETHSQNFVLRIRRLIAEGKLNPDDFALYYVDFNEDNNESELKRIIVHDGGNVDFWPEGIFGESVIEARAIMNANINDLKNVD
jgi:predicted ATPase